MQILGIDDEEDVKVETMLGFHHRKRMGKGKRAQCKSGKIRPEAWQPRRVV
jgi:hypothetical protein